MQMSACDVGGTLQPGRTEQVFCVEDKFNLITPVRRFVSCGIHFCYIFSHRSPVEVFLLQTNVGYTNEARENWSQGYTNSLLK